MLSIRNIGRSSWRYYQCTVAIGAREYYTERGDRPGRWHGTGLADLGLTPDALASERELEALFGRAMSPTTGTQLGRGWRVDAVTGYDLTFSAPKSVSALWALADQRTGTAVTEAHEAAVKAGLDFLQDRAGWSRRGRNGIEPIRTTGYSAVRFDHVTSRTGDPQLHTHTLLLNKTLCVDGQWRTWDGREVYHHLKAAGAIYQAALRSELTSRLPVGFEPVSRNGQAELLGAPEELLTAWSSRSTVVRQAAFATIDDAQAALGRQVTPAERAKIIQGAVLSTRPPKQTGIDPAQLRERWTAQAAALGWNFERLAAVLHTPTARTPTANWREATARAAVAAVGESTAFWSRADLTVQVAAHLPAGVGPAQDIPGLVKQIVDLALDIDIDHEPQAAAETPAPSAVPGVPAVAVLGVDGAPVPGPAEAPVPEPAPAPVVLGRFGVVPLGVVQSGVTERASDARYATAGQIQVEARIIDRVTAGGYRRPARLHPAITDQLADPVMGLSVEQQHAVVKLVATRDVVTLVTAPAGAGKTRMLGAATAMWWRESRQVVCLAPSARAGAELGAATGAGWDTVAGWLTHQARLAERDETGLARGAVVIIDEASMLTTADLDQLTAQAGAVPGVRLVLVGDPAQIGAVQAPGGMFEHLLGRLGPRVVALRELHRFTQGWEATATLALHDGDPNVLEVYAEHGRIHPAADTADAADAVFGQWHDNTQAGRDVVMLARSWADVTALNARARAAAIATGQVTGPDLVTVTTRTASTGGRPEERGWRVGDVLIARHNTGQVLIGGQKLRNGDRFTVTAAAPGRGGKVQGLVVSDHAGRGSTTLPPAYLARHVEYGWATTIDGAQGVTADIGIVLARTGLDREHLYVAMTRGRHENHVHTSPEPPDSDAGPHHEHPTPTAQQACAAGRVRQVPGQLTLPDLDLDLAPARPFLPVVPDPQVALTGAVDQLSRAMAVNGRERAAHTLLSAYVEQERERTWRTQLDATPPVKVPAEHLRHRDTLTAHHGDLDQLTTRAHELSQHLRALHEQVTRLPFWSRAHRTALTEQITNGNTYLTRLIDQDIPAAQHGVTQAAAVVSGDDQGRLDTDVAARAEADRNWCDRPTTAYLDPNTLTWPIGTWTERERHQPRDPAASWEHLAPPQPEAHTLER